jgi:hypothetical protein
MELPVYAFSWKNPIWGINLNGHMQYVTNKKPDVLADQAIIPAQP